MDLIWAWASRTSMLPVPLPKRRCNCVNVSVVMRPSSRRPLRMEGVVIEKMEASSLPGVRYERGSVGWVKPRAFQISEATWLAPVRL